MDLPVKSQAKTKEKIVVTIKWEIVTKAETSAESEKLCQRNSFIEIKQKRLLKN